jgi:hypothetical protein
MYQPPTLIQTLAAIGINVEATDTRITIRSINQEWLAAACVQQKLEEDLGAMRLRWFGSPEAAQADFNTMMRRSDAAWEEAEAAETPSYWLEDPGWDE